MSSLRHLARSLKRRLPKSEIDFGGLRRFRPFTENFGYDRGQPIDRYYTENFLAEHSTDVRGRVLEVGDDSYSRRSGGSRISQQDVLHVMPKAPGATLTADIANAPHIPSNTFDCIIFTQTLQYVFDARTAIATLHRILKPGGALLLAVPGLSRLTQDEVYQVSDSGWSIAGEPRALLILRLAILTSATLHDTATISPFFFSIAPW
jgi:SAM-dependent methyltransferase